MLILIGAKMILNEIAGYKEPVKQKDVVTKQREKIKKLAKAKRKKLKTHDEIRANSLKSLTSTLSNIHK